MKYGRQRFLIFFLYAALPVVALFALVQTPYVSDLILNFSLRVVRFRTGVHITAQGWQVKPLQFAAELSTIHVETGRIVVDAPSVQVWVSPLYLLMGEVHLNDLRFDRPKVSGTLPPDFFAKKNSDNSFLKDFFKKDVPTEFGQLVEKGVNFVAKRNLYLEKFSLVNAEVQVGEIQGQRVSLELDNLGAGQLHLDLDLVKFEIKKQLQLIPSFKASFGLLKADKKKFTLVVPEFEVHLDDKSINTLRANGSWPGESRLILGLELKQLFTWIKASPLLGDIGVKALAGTVKGDFTVRVANKGFQTFNGSAQTEGLKIDEFYPNNLSISVEGTPERTEISQVSIRLPFEVGDNPSWHHRMDLEKIVIEKGAITGSMKLDQAGLCGILLASGIDECFSPLKFSGKAQFSGKIDPFEIDVNPDITMEGGEVHTDPVQQHKDSRLLVIKSAKVTGMVQVFAKKVVFPNSVLSWGTDSSANCNGEVTYKPTLVGLNIRSSKAEFKPLIASFLDLEVLGTAEINARVDYSIKLSKAEGRTKVAASVNMINAGIEGQNFGTAIGDVTYKKNELTIGPMRVTNGGGQAIINGKLVQKSGNSFLTLDGDMQRLEVRAITPQAGTEIFSGFATGKMAIAGYTNSKSPEFLSGPFNFDVDNFKVFGVPFQKGQIKAE